MHLVGHGYATVEYILTDIIRTTITTEGKMWTRRSHTDVSGNSGLKLGFAEG